MSGFGKTCWRCLIQLLLSVDPVLFSPSVQEDTHIYEALALVTRYQLSLLPVVSTEGEYRGVITRDKLIDILSELCNADTAGSVFVLEVMPQDYSMTDIARLIEANNAHILSLLSYTDKDDRTIASDYQNRSEDVSPLIRSFERFNYTVLYYFMEKEWWTTCCSSGWKNWSVI